MPQRSFVLVFESFLEHLCFSHQDLFWTRELLPRLFATASTNLCQKTVLSSNLCKAPMTREVTLVRVSIFQILTLSRNKINGVHLSDAETNKYFSSSTVTDKLPVFPDFPHLLLGC